MYAGGGGEGGGVRGREEGMLEGIRLCQRELRSSSSSSYSYSSPE